MLTLIFLALVNVKAPMPFHTAVLIINAAREENVDPALLTKILIVESRGNPKAINQKTQDYGIAQINLKSHPYVTKNCAMNKACGIRAGARILAKAHKPCSYNLGNRGSIKNPKTCLQYHRKLANVNLLEDPSVRKSIKK